MYTVPKLAMTTALALVAFGAGRHAGLDTALASPGRGPVALLTPADGHTIHVLAPHVVNGQTMGPYHHYCKVIRPDPVIECLVYASTDTLAPLEQVEYIVAKTITRTDAISLADWNANWHDHTQEIATGRVQVLDLPPDQAQSVAQTVAGTDGIIFHLWSRGDRVPSGHVIIGQSVGHVNITMAEKMNGGRPAMH
jgi:uncharacterized protein DUF1264